MNSVGDTASKVIESGGDIATAPVTWLKDMQQNWLMYMIAVAVILSTITFLYCVLRLCIARKKKCTS